ncbi:hypothetical protein ASG51_03740 [Methylobacterium sp. Leaf465]|nr:hypothetical protein ASG51_03740 [Methylobacterium sp. Leaf465]
MRGFRENRPHAEAFLSHRSRDGTMVLGCLRARASGEGFGKGLREGASGRSFGKGLREGACAADFSLAPLQGRVVLQ